MLAIICYYMQMHFAKFVLNTCKQYLFNSGGSSMGATELQHPLVSAKHWQILSARLKRNVFEFYFLFLSFFFT